jgi:hypothetical protein
MGYNLNRYYRDNDFNYINDIVYSIERNIIDASEKNHSESFYKLLDFHIYELKNKSIYKSKRIYAKAVSSYIYIYPQLHYFKKDFIEQIFRSLIMDVNRSVSHRIEVDPEYHDLPYLGVLNILKLTLESDDADSFNNAIKIIEEDISFTGQNHPSFLNFITVLLTWIYYLKLNNSISYEKYDINYLEDKLDSTSYDNINFINNFFELFGKIEDNGLWAVADWQLEKPQLDEDFTATLSPNKWLPQGLAILLLKFDHLINSRAKDIELDERFIFIYDDLKKTLDKIDPNNEPYLALFENHINNDDRSEIVNARKERILITLLQFKKEIEIRNYKTIGATPLSSEKIEDFRLGVGKLWEDNSMVLNILKALNKIDYAPEDENSSGVDLFKKLLRMRFAFTDGNYNRYVMGLHDFGSELARKIDDTFFKRFKPTKAVTKENIGKALLKFIKRSENIGDIVIFANWEIIRNLNGITYNHKGSQSISNLKFNEVPIVNHYSEHKDFVMVIDFSKIRAAIYTNDNPNMYKNQLLVEVTESPREAVTPKDILIWNRNDGYKYDENEVDIIQSNHVNVKVELKYQMTNLDEARYLKIALPQRA